MNYLQKLILDCETLGHIIIQVSSTTNPRQEQVVYCARCHKRLELQTSYTI